MGEAEERLLPGAEKREEEEVEEEWKKRKRSPTAMTTMLDEEDVAVVGKDGVNIILTRTLMRRF